MKARQILFKTARIIGRLFYRKHVWLISDREGSAGDNGEAFFKYLQSKAVNAVFAIRKDSEDYDRISKIGNVVDMRSLKYKLLLCISDCHCSSQLFHMENHIETPQIFLQHGVAYSDISKMIKPVNHKNFYIITVSDMEREQLIRGGVSEDHVWLTGLPRFDYLKCKDGNKVIAVFSWRASLSGLNEDVLKESRYYKMLDRIIKDEELREEISRRGYKLYFKLHPEVLRHKHFFSEVDENYFYTDTYNKLFEEVSLMVTDYSSAISDCVYMYKPIIYFQFDQNQFYEGNPFVSLGLFDYENHGFGPVITDYDDLKSAILGLIDEGCRMEEKYREHVDEYFKYIDKDNCERVFDKIRTLLNKY